ncbi:hypothetical protein OAX78_00805 [Planctomycetota bacterium]|nr:hypothetical protein [Planctomycetota bacterium]
MGSETPFEAQREWFGRYLRAVLEEAEPITPDNVEVVELLLMEAELDAVRKALADAGPPAFDPGQPVFASQWGTTCMSTSLANGMISMGEGLLVEGGEAQVHAFTSDIVESTSSFGKPGEYRSVDDLFKYLESGRLGELDFEGAGFQGDFRVRLTNSLLDTCEALWTGRGRLVVQRRAHAHLVYGLELDGNTFWALTRDPMRRTGPGGERLAMEALRRDYLWSPLKKIPRLMGPHAFPQLSAEALLGHLERYDEMDNLGVDCPSALLFRAEDAPERRSEPPEEPE